MTETTRTQHRATCPACLRDHAVTSGGRMVAHGYRRIYLGGGNLGGCFGEHRPHLGTEEGSAYAEKIAKHLRDLAADAARTADDIAARFDGGHYSVSTRMFRDPEQRKLAGQYRQAKAAGRAALEDAGFIEQRLAVWKPEAPRAVQVERKGGPLLHYCSPKRRNGQGKACAVSAYAAHRGANTADADRVTCPKCRAMIEAGKA